MTAAISLFGWDLPLPAEMDLPRRDADEQSSVWGTETAFWGQACFSIWSGALTGKFFCFTVGQLFLFPLHIYILNSDKPSSISIYFAKITFPVAYSSKDKVDNKDFGHRTCEVSKSCFLSPCNLACLDRSVDTPPTPTLPAPPSAWKKWHHLVVPWQSVIARWSQIAGRKRRISPAVYCLYPP